MGQDERKGVKNGSLSANFTQETSDCAIYQMTSSKNEKVTGREGREGEKKERKINAPRSGVIPNCSPGRSLYWP